MISESSSVCPKCGGTVSHYDTVKRVLRGKGGKKSYIRLERVLCSSCGSVHRVMTDDIFPYKHYESEIIRGVLEGLITCETLGFEDHPCEKTMLRWLSTDFVFT